MTDDLISRRALFERTATLEAQALDYVGKLIERDGEETSVEWRIWSAILTERTAFKHDVYDAPSAQPDPQECEKCIFKPFKQFRPERKVGKWEKHRESYCSWSCSVCKEIVVAMPERMGYPLYDYCPNCGADMRGDNNG